MFLIPSPIYMCAMNIELTTVDFMEKAVCFYHKNLFKDIYLEPVRPDCLKNTIIFLDDFVRLD
jgi:hypothetical protein